MAIVSVAASSSPSARAPSSRITSGNAPSTTTDLNDTYSKIANSVCRTTLAPSVNAGPDRWVWLDDTTVHLSGTPSSAASGQTLAWSLVSGPGHVTFGASSQGNSS